MNAALTCDSRNEKATGKRSAGNPHAAFDEGSQGNTLAPTLLVQSCLVSALPG